MTAPARQDVLFDVAPEPEPTPPPPKPKEKKPPPPRETDGCCEIYRQATGSKYAFRDAIDGKAWAWLRQRASVEEIEERFRLGLTAKGYLHTASLAQLASKWNELGVLLAQQRPPQPQAVEDDKPAVSLLPACEACGVVGKTWFRIYRHWLCTPCVEQARAVADSVPLPSPRPLSPGDARCREWRDAQDSAVGLWARSRKEMRR